MNTECTIGTPQRSHRKHQQFFRLGLAGLFTLLVAFGLLGGAWIGQANLGAGVGNNIKPQNAQFAIHQWPKNNEFAADRVSAQNETPTPTPLFRGLSDSPPPKYVPSPSNSSAPSGTPAQVYVNFDVFPSGAPVPSGITISDQYPPAIFSSDYFHRPVADNRFWNTSFPNILRGAPGANNPFSDDGTGYAPIYVDFTTPVNDLKFYVVAVDEFRRRIAQINIFQNNRLTATRDIDGFGRVFQPILVDVGGWGFKNVTRIEIFNIDDYLGVGFDDFSFNIAPPPSPTPTPTPPVPAAPTGLTATASDERVTLSWNASQGADGYYVKRSGGTANFQTIAAVSTPTTTTTSIIVPVRQQVTSILTSRGARPIPTLSQRSTLPAKAPTRTRCWRPCLPLAETKLLICHHRCISQEVLAGGICLLR